MWYLGQFKEELAVPDSTVNGWILRYKAGIAFSSRGRPTILTKEEEELVARAVKFMRQKGSPIDREVLQQMGRKTMSRQRNIPLDKTPELSESWAKSFRKRHHFTRFVILTSCKVHMPTFFW